MGFITVVHHPLSFFHFGATTEQAAAKKDPSQMVKVPKKATTGVSTLAFGIGPYH